MTQNRNKLLSHLVGNLASAVVHKVLEEAAGEEPIKKYYYDEFSNSIEAAKRYREKVNPVNEPLSDKDTAQIREKVVAKAITELKLRIVRGYKNISLDKAEKATEELLADLNVISRS